MHTASAISGKSVFGSYRSWLPLNAIVCGLPGALSVTESVPVKSPVWLGAKVTSIVQFAPDARVELQVFV